MTIRSRNNFKKKGQKTMEYENFKEQFVEDVKAGLSDSGIEANVTVNTVNKLNESYEAMTITPEGTNIGVNLPIEKFFEAYDDGMNYNAVVDKAVDVTLKGFEQAPIVDVAAFGDYEQMKDKLVMEVVSSEANKEMLETVPHKDIEDMAVVYRFVLESNDESRASVLVTNRMMENMGITAEQLHADAVENAPQLKPLEIKGMGEVVAEMMGMTKEEASQMGIIPFDPSEEKMFVASVPDKIHGAGVLAYQDFMDQASERVGGDFFILPSSIHELLIVPDDGHVKLEDLKGMVKEVNETQVDPKDRLTDSVYHYDSQAKVFEIGEKFEERKASREETAEKDADKGSLLDDLKAKKEEVAKAPKKDPPEKEGKTKSDKAR